VLENIFSVKGGLLTGPPGILAIENRLLSLEIRLRLLLFHLHFHFSNHLEELAFGEWSWISVVGYPLQDRGRGVSTSKLHSTAMSLAMETGLVQDPIMNDSLFL